MAKVSILIPVYNTQDFIAESIESILNQTYGDFELVIVDDCSTDDTYSICQRYASSDSRIKLFRNEKNLGMMPNWNYGMSLCTGDYWGKLDADDWWDQEMIEVCVNILDVQPEVGLVCAGHDIINESGETMNDQPLPAPDQFMNQAFSCVDLVKQGPHGFLSYPVMKQGIGLMRRGLIEKVGNFMEFHWGDTEMWFRIGAHSQTYYVDRILHHHRKWSDSDTVKIISQNMDTIYSGLYKTRMQVVNYYFQHGLVSEHELMDFRKITIFEHNKYLISKFRKESSYLHMGKCLFLCLFSFPRRTFLEILHLDRIFFFR